mmetsp:Transcript_24022/g.59367  ORF Transcript_24022/g.59367 Transcript_24022/m.59367 type:complete len:269 (+) Transcript_24022:445-1251(+)
MTYTCTQQAGRHSSLTHTFGCHSGHPPPISLCLSLIQRPTHMEECIKTHQGRRDITQADRQAGRQKGVRQCQLAEKSWLIHCPGCPERLSSSTARLSNMALALRSARSCRVMAFSMATLCCLRRALRQASKDVNEYMHFLVRACEVSLKFSCRHRRYATPGMRHGCWTVVESLNSFMYFSAFISLASVLRESSMSGLPWTMSFHRTICVGGTSALFIARPVAFRLSSCFLIPCAFSMPILRVRNQSLRSLSIMWSSCLTCCSYFSRSE